MNQDVVFHPIKVKRSLILFMILSVLAWPITLYLAYNHFNPTGSKICNVSDYISCDVVNLSPYSELFGIPVAILGFFTYVFLFFVAMGLYKGFSFDTIISRVNRDFAFKMLVAITLVGLLFSVRLTYIEFFVLKAVCLFCIAQQVIIILLFAISVYILKVNQQNS